MQPSSLSVIDLTSALSALYAGGQYQYGSVLLLQVRPYWILMQFPIWVRDWRVYSFVGVTLLLQLL